MAYDLTSKVSPYLDRHLVFPLLEFLQDRQIYSEEEILKAKIELLAKTNMVDYAADIHKSLYHTEEIPEAMVERRAEVVAKLKALEDAAAPIVNFLQDPQLVQELRSEKQYNLMMLQEKYQIGVTEIEGLYQYAKFQFECGNYSGAADFLQQYRLLSVNGEKLINASWGKLAAEILVQNWEAASEELNRLKEAIDARNFSSPLSLLQQRTWLLHWSLFIFFNTDNGRNNLIDLFLQDKYLNAIQTSAPHLLRYLVAAVLTSKRRRSLMKEVVRMVEVELYSYRDPLTDFMLCLFAKYDFDGAQLHLQECEKLLACDFFLGKQVDDNGFARMPFKDEFLDSARLYIFESFCRIHQCIKIDVIAEKLNMTHEAAERWILNLIRTAKLEAKIDSDEGTVVMVTQHPSVYETLIERTKGLTARTYAMATSVAAVASAAR